MPEVVIIGAGVIGASIAYHLARRGCRDVVVLDRESRPGGGSTSRATGGFRTQFGTEINIRLSLLSREKLLRFREETGVDPGYATSGYLFVARSQSVLSELRALNELQRSCGIEEARLISASEARLINPAITDETILGGAFCPTDGFIRAMEILRGYCEGATRAGVRFELDCGQISLRSERGHIVTVRTARGEITARSFVNAAGAWAADVSDVPVKPLPRSVAATVTTDRFPPSMPMTIWADDGFHLRVRDARVLLLRPQQREYGTDLELDDSWLTDVTNRAHERIAALREIPIDRTACWSGLYEMSPDRHVILGRATDYDNLFLAVGSSGHGVMHSPAIGEILAALVTGDEPPFDVHALRPSRFAEGDGIPSSELL